MSFSLGLFSADACTYCAVSLIPVISAYRACSTYGGKEKCVQGSGGET
jgi:hypothetical protein